MNPSDLAQLRRIQWAVRATLVLGVTASVAANVLHARHHPIAQAIAAWPPLALLITVELVSRVPMHRRSLGIIRIIATTGIAGIAAFMSYQHMAGVASRYGEVGVAPYLLPLSVDGLIIASVSLAELAGRIRDLGQPPVAFATDLRPSAMTPHVDHVDHADLDSEDPARINGKDPELPADRAEILLAARAARDDLLCEGRVVGRIGNGWWICRRNLGDVVTERDARSGSRHRGFADLSM